MSFISRLRNKILFQVYITINQRVFRNRLKYIYSHVNSSSSLLVVFSAFSGEKRKYNYIKSFNKLNINKLFILDDFGYKGSYYLYENGTDLPFYLVQELIKEIMLKYKIVKLFTAGSSKGGSAALIHGLELNACGIFSGSCQYHIGSYLSIDKHIDILKAMVGNLYKLEDIKNLDIYIKNKIINHNKSYKPIIFLQYSVNEQTYIREIIDLRKDLLKSEFTLIEDIKEFTEHEDIGIYFPLFVIDKLKKHFDS